MYVDITGKLPLYFIDGMTTVFTLYDWDSDAILSTPITHAKYETTIKAFKYNVTYLHKRVFKPKFNIIDNVDSKTVQAYLESCTIRIQLVEVHNHWDKSALREIQTYKNHLIAGLCSCDEIFPTIL